MFEKQFFISGIAQKQPYSFCFWLGRSQKKNREFFFFSWLLYVSFTGTKNTEKGGGNTAKKKIIPNDFVTRLLSPEERCLIERIEAHEIYVDQYIHNHMITLVVISFSHISHGSFSESARGGEGGSLGKLLSFLRVVLCRSLSFSLSRARAAYIR